MSSDEFDTITVLPGTLRLPKPDHFAECEAKMGIALPPSYREFALRFGYGLLCDLFLIYVPLGGDHDSLELRWEELRDTIRESLEEDLVEFEPDGSPELVVRLCPFGISENGHTLAWDPGSSGADGELDVYVLGNKMLSVARAGRTFRDLTAAARGAGVQRVIGSGYQPLPPTFRPAR